MMKRKIGKMMRAGSVCAVLICGSAALVHAEEVYVECTEILEEYVIEPEEYFSGTEYSFTEELITEISAMPQADMAQPTDTEIIQEAIETGTDVTITVHEDIVLDSTIIIPSGKNVTFVPADGKQVTMFRGEELCETFFFVEEDATLILGSESLNDAALLIDIGANSMDDTVSGDGQVRILSGVEMAALNTVSEDIVIGDGDVAWEPGDLSEAYIEIMGGENLVYNGMPQTPDVLVWMGTQMLMKGFDYDVTYSNNVNAGEAEIMIHATGIGTCTGNRSVPFMIAPAMVQYEINDQIVECGIEISQLMVPECAVGVTGETVEGELLWAASEGGFALPSDMLLSGADGDTMELYWTFFPEEGNTNYLPAYGSMTITFEMPQLPDAGGFGDEDLWGDLGDEVGDLSNGSSSSGVTDGEDITVDISTEYETEEPEKETEELTTEAPITEEAETEKPQLQKPETEKENKPETEKIVVKNPASGSSGNRIPGSSGVSISKSNPRTGDESNEEVWLFLMVTALLTGFFMLDMRGRIRYNVKR